MIFTKENLIENLDKVGPWSMLCLAEEAVEHYFPWDDEYGSREVKETVKLVKQLGYENFQDLVEKFHTDVGYKPEEGTFNSDCINQY